MDAPYGLVYKPSFPSMQSVFTQMAQMQRLAQKEYAERTKEADKRAYDSVKNLYKFNADPINKAYETYKQTRMSELFSLAAQVRAGKADPLLLEEAMATFEGDVKRVKQFESEVNSYFTALKADGSYYNNDELIRAVSKGMVDLTNTQINGTTTYLPPSALDSDYVIRSVKNNVNAYNRDALAQTFVDNLQKRFNQELIDNEPTNIRGTSAVERTATLPESMTEINENGKKVVKVDSRKLGLWDAQGATWVNYLNARVISETGDENSVKDGKKRQEVLQKIMNEAGFVDDTKKTELRNIPREPSDVDRSGTRFDSTKYVTGTAKDDLRYEKEAKVYADLFSAPMDVRTELAIDLFNGPGVESVKVLPPDSKSQYGYVVIKKEKSFQGINLAQSGSSGAKEDDNTVTIELSPKRLKTLSAYANAIRGGDTNPTLLAEMYKKLEDRALDESIKKSGKKTEAEELGIK